MNNKRKNALAQILEEHNIQKLAQEAQTIGTDPEAGKEFADKAFDQLAEEIANEFLQIVDSKL